ncbi:MAG: hypothetical protein MUF45_11720 [Spirosomaceae bacterium]|jgi:hypothetical protein|nr:hypothetical protein [Spirosomataceae bacterium]
MKTKFLAILASLALFISCNKDEVDSKSAFFRVKIDGKLVEAIGVSAYAVKNSDEFNMYGLFNSTSSMYLQLANSKGVGTHVASENPNFIFYTDDTATGNRSDRTGTSAEITITEKTDKVVKGTFKGTVKASNQATKVYTLTEGEFSVEFR